MESLFSVLPKDLVHIIQDYARDRTNYDKVMEQLLLQSSVHYYGFFLTFRKEALFKSKFYSTLDNFSAWVSGGLYGHISDPIMNCEGKLRYEGVKRWKPKKEKRRKPEKRRNV